MKLIPAALLLILCGGAARATSLPGPAFPRFEDPAAVAQACDSGLAQVRSAIRRMQRHAPDSGWLQAYDELSGFIEDRSGAFDLLPNVHPDAALRDAAEKCQQRWQELFSALGQDQRLYRALRRVKPRDAIEAELRGTLLKNFEDAGVSLQGARRERARQINDKLNELRVAFDKNVRDAKLSVPFDEAELKGVPPAVWANAPRDAQGRVLLGVDYPVYDPVMQLAESGAARERMWRAKSNEGGDANLALLRQITRLRKEYAGLMGQPSFADFVLRRRMARTVDDVRRFLAEVQQTVEARERVELEELRQAKAAHLGQPADTVRMQRWDVSFYAERVRQQRFGVDQEGFRRYFPPQASLDFVLRLTETLMGVKYTRVEGVDLWHPDVQAYAVSDAASGRALATLWVDLYPREGKYNHAAVWPLRGSSLRSGRAAQAALVVNFNRQGLSLEELETLLHELGHAVHNNLSATRFALQAGTSVLWDFVEAPSQMLEDWVYDPAVLALFSQVCPSCEKVPADMLERARAAKGYPKGVFAARQRLYASYDMTLHDAEASDPMATWVKLEGATPLGHVSDTRFPAGFGHVAGGYAAGYYGYLWSLVVAMDLRSAFEGHRLDPAVGLRYRREVLAQGSQRPPQSLVRNFLGRPFNAKAFFDDLAK